MGNELRIAAAAFRVAMTAVGIARDRLAHAVAAETGETPDDVRQLFELRARLKGGELSLIFAATRLVPEPDIGPAVKGVK